MRKIIALFLVVVMLGVSIVACSTASTPDTKSTEGEGTAGESVAEQKTLKIGYANLGDTMQFAMDVQNGCKKVAKEYGVDIICVDNNFDAQKAIENTDALLLQGCDGIIMFNTDESTNPAVKDKCDAAGVPVITVEINMPNAPFMGADNYVSGYLVGKELGKYANERWNGEIDYVLLVELPRSGESTQMRMNSVLDGIKELIPSFEPIEEGNEGANVARVDGENDVLPAQQRTAEFLTAHPDAKHILIATLNDSNGLGSFNAVQAAGREDDCIIVAHGCSTPMQEHLWGLLKEGKTSADSCWPAGIAYFPEFYGEKLIPAIIDMINGKEVPAELHPDHAPIDTTNINDYYPDPNG